MDSCTEFNLQDMVHNINKFVYRQSNSTSRKHLNDYSTTVFLAYVLKNTENNTEIIKCVQVLVLKQLLFKNKSFQNYINKFKNN